MLDGKHRHEIELTHVSCLHLIFQIHYDKYSQLYWEGLRFLELIVLLYNPLLKSHEHFILKVLDIHWYSLMQSFQLNLISESFQLNLISGGMIYIISFHLRSAKDRLRKNVGKLNCFNIGQNLWFNFFPVSWASFHWIHKSESIIICNLVLLSNTTVFKWPTDFSCMTMSICSRKLNLWRIFRARVSGWIIYMDWKMYLFELDNQMFLLRKGGEASSSRYVSFNLDLIC